MDKRDVTLKWNDRNMIEKGHKIYRSKSPIDINNPPEPIGSLERNIDTFIDKDQPIGESNYYRVSAWIDGTELFSDEVYLEVTYRPEIIGGETISINIADKYYRLHMFKNVGDNIFSISRGGLVDVLVVAGGSGGGGGISGDYWGGGGGAGEVVWSTSTTVSVGEFTATVGDGGFSATSASQGGNAGNPSSVFDITAKSGTAARNGYGGNSGNGFTGGGRGTSGRGAGGGAGASENGGDGGLYGGDGGDGIDLSAFLGSTIGDDGWFGGGGAGYNADSSGGIGGKGGGATPTSSSSTVNNSGMANTGGGAGERTGKGGSGIVILRYEISPSEYNGT